LPAIVAMAASVLVLGVCIGLAWSRL
jgi:hypothetical protein